MTYPDGHKKELVFYPQMRIQHYKMRMAGNDLTIAGCGCRGCMWAWQKQANSQVAAPLAAALNSWLRSVA